MANLLSIEDALERILASINLLPSESVGLENALGRVLAQDIVADIDLPPFPNSSMDGYAVRAADVAAASQDHPATLRVVLDIPAGAAPDRSVNAGEAARIMTGAPMPDGADAVIPVEQTDSRWSAGDGSALPENVQIFSAVKAGDYVRPIGEDIRAGQIVVKAGAILRPQEIGVLAGLGCVQAPVIRQPRVALLSSGDELVEPHEPLTPGKIRNTNSYTLAGLVTLYGGAPVCIPTARDTLDDVRRRFAEALEMQPDLILSSAGVSVGSLDFVRTVLEELGQVDFWRVNLRPGKPLAYGHLRGVPFFGLPGNPVSAMVTFDVFVRPVLLKMTNRPDAVPTALATLGEDIASDGRRSYIRVTLTREQGQLIAHTTGTQSSGALMSMVLADGLLILPEGIKQASAGMQFPVRILKNLE